MTTNRSSAGGLPKGPSAPRRWAKPPGLALMALAVVALLQAGCRSDGCSTCGIGGIGNKLTNGVQALGARVFKHGSGGTVVGGGGCCGGSGGIEEGTIVDSGIPMSPGGMVVPGPLIPAPVEAPPTDLRPLDDNRTTPAPTGATSTPSQTQSRNQPTGNNRSAYEANRKSSGARGRAGDVARAVHSPASQGAEASLSSGSSDLLDHIPPVDLSSEVTSKAVAPDSGLPAAAPIAKEETAAPESRPVAAPAQPAAENVSAAEGPVVTLPTLAGPVGHGATPGILKCSSVEPHLMGGSLPTAEGLDWLKQRGYKTFLDLRSRSEVDPSFVDSVYDRGMVYVALPIMVNRLDASRLARFDDLVSQADNRPLYFCDTDGSRAGLAWYIHRMTVDHYDPQTAAHEAEEMGLPESRLKDATAYLAARPVGGRPSVATAPEPAPIAAPLPASTGPKPAAPAAKSAEVDPPTSAPVAMTARVDADVELPKSSEEIAPTPTPPAAPEATPAPEVDATASDVMRPQVSAPKPENLRDPMAMKWIASLLLAAVGLPLAYWSRSAVSFARSTRRASRPAKGPRLLEARPASDA